MSVRLFGGERREWWTLAAVSAGLFMTTLDNTVVNVALPKDETPPAAAPGGVSHWGVPLPEGAGAESVVLRPNHDPASGAGSGRCAPSTSLASGRCVVASTIGAVSQQVK